MYVMRSEVSNAHRSKQTEATRAVLDVQSLDYRKGKYNVTFVDSDHIVMRLAMGAETDVMVLQRV